MIAGGGLCVLLGLYGVALVVGVPGWVPDGVVARVPGLRP